MALDPVTALFDAGKMIISRVWPDPAQQAEQLFKLEQLKQNGDLAELSARVQAMTGQLDINKQEAAHASIFVAGWRPFVGWSCGFALLYASIVEPLMRFIASMSGYAGTFPEIDTAMTIQVLIGMLGLVGARSYEKKNGVHRDNLNTK
jgi:hypothetical protein